MNDRQRRAPRLSRHARRLQRAARPRYVTVREFSITMPLRVPSDELGRFLSLCTTEARATWEEHRHG